MIGEEDITEALDIHDVTEWLEPDDEEETGFVCRRIHARRGFTVAASRRVRRPRRR